jgi:para-nitrobenzyl esterase
MRWKSVVVGLVGVALVLAFIAMPDSYAGKDPHKRLGNNLVDPIKTDAGYVSGTMIDVFQRCWVYYFDAATGDQTCDDNLMGEIGKAIRIYRGIPYAEPPVGDLRWRAPQPVTPWEGIRESTKFTPAAPQPFPMSFFYGNIPESDISEDCLYLNVSTPAKHENERLPVMVWFHGGGITGGTNSPVSVGNYVGPAATQTGPPLPNYGVVLVSVQHRLGAIGFMAHPALSAESEHNTSGNYGQLDLIAALQWVQKNIAAFGGDPNNVTIFGQSGGGMKTSWLVGSPLAEGLFHRAIIQAGLSATGTPLATAEQYGLNLADRLGISDPGPAGLEALRQKSWQEIITASNTPGSGYSTVFTADDYALPTGNFLAAPYNDVPLMVGMAGQDMELIFRGTKLYLPMIQQKSPIYAFVFNQVPDGWKALGVGAWHGSEVASQFGNVGMGLGMFLGALLPSTLPLDPGVTFKDEWVSEYMTSMLAKFAESGNPSGVMKIKWPAFDHRDQYLDIGYKPIVKTGFTQLVYPVMPR